MPQQPASSTVSARPGTAPRARSVSSAPKTAFSWQCGWTRARPPGAKRSRPAAAASATRARPDRDAAATAAASRSPGSRRCQSSSTIAWHDGSRKTIGRPARACGASDLGGRSRRLARLVDHADRQHHATAAAGRHHARPVAGGAQQAQQRLADLRLLMLDEAVGEDHKVGVVGRRAGAPRQRPARDRRQAAPRVDAGERRERVGERAATERVQQRRERRGQSRQRAQAGDGLGERRRAARARSPRPATRP